METLTRLQDLVSHRLLSHSTQKTTRMKIFSIAKFAFFIAASTWVSSVPALSPPSSVQPRDPLKLVLGEENLELWKNGILTSAAQAPGPAIDGEALVLAGSRTKRPDILRRFKQYRGGWDIANKHYWASVGFTGAAAFILAVVWFVSFGMALVIHHCFGWRIKVKGEGSELPQRICLIMIIVFTSVAAIGCILLSVGQDEFHGEAMHTLKYVVNQSEYTVQILTNVTEYLSLAKTINVAQIYIPSDVTDKIDELIGDLNTAADTLHQKTSENSRKIQGVFNTMRSSLITVAAVMLLLSLLGLVLSYLGHKHAIHIFIISGWVLVAVTFIICGSFVILNNVVSDTCMAMGEWVDNPHAETALSNILPCVDQRTTKQTLVQSKQIINDIVNIINQFIYNVADSNLSPQAGPLYFYNQSGPLVPPLCYPYDDRLQVRECVSSEVSLANASMVWKNFTCVVSAASSLCTSPGRLSPDIYNQLVAAVNISMALQLYTPPLLSLQDCNFVRDTFRNITANYCPPLEDHLQMVNTGLAMISVGVMLCLALWFFYANRPQREEVFANLSLRIRSGCGYKSGCKNIRNVEVSSRGTTPISIV